jgi:hypothetical protein
MERLLRCEVGQILNVVEVTGFLLLLQRRFPAQIGQQLGINAPGSSPRLR